MNYRAVLVGFILAAVLVMGADAKAAGQPDYVEFTVHDLAKTKAFYSAVFGWTFTDYGPGYTSFEGATVGGGFTTDGPVQPSGGPLMVFYVKDVDATFGKAEAAGATHLLIGRFHKMSTLVQQAKFDVIDVKARKLVFDRHITFRGDNDAAWRRAETFLARQILEHGEW